MNRVFLDTSYAVALSATTDENHARAAELADEVEKSGAHFITTRAILLEIGNALSKVRHRSAAIKLDKGITEALTADNHFRQAGFRVLL